MKKLWPFGFFFLFFAAIAAYMPYTVLYFQSLEFTGAQIGLLIGLSPLITLVTVPFWTRTADRTNKHRSIMTVSLLVAVTSLAIFPLLQTFLAIFAVTLISNIFMAPVISLANSATMFMLGDEKDLFGRVRVGGTIGFGITALVTGFIVEAYDLKAAFWIGAGLLFIGFLISTQLVYGKEDGQPVEDEGSMVELIKSPSWIFFLILAFIGGVAFAAGNSYFFPYMQELGMDESTMGLVLTLGTIAEIPILFLANRFIRRFNAYGTLILSLAFTGARLMLFGLTSAPAAVMLIQALNGLSIPLLMVAGVSYADEYAPEGLRTTGQGLFNTALMGVGAAVGGFISGILLARIGGQGLYLLIGLAVLISLAVVVFLRSRFPDQVDFKRG